MSLVVIAVAVSVAVIGLSGAWFSDIQTTELAGSPGANDIYTAKIELDAISPMATITDLKPCIKQWGRIVVHNVGDNDGNGWLHITKVIGEDEVLTHAEEAAYDALGRISNDVERYITVDLYVDPIWDNERSGGVVVISPEDHWKMSDLECQWIPLGVLPVSTHVEVWLSFHLQDETGNEYQADKVTFDLEVLLQQENAPPPSPLYESDWRVLRLENKDSAGDWIIQDDDRYGMLTFDCVGSTFEYTFEGYGLEDDDWCLIYYADPWPGNNPGKLIDSGTVSGGDGRLSLSGNVNLGMDMPDPSDANYPEGAKIWLIPCDYYTEPYVNAWPASAISPPTGWLFEERLITYNDTDV